MPDKTLDPSAFLGRLFAFTPPLEFLAAGAFLLALLLTKTAFAQQLPDAGSILRDTERALPSQPPRLAPQAVPERPAVKPAEGVRFVVRAFRLTGVTLVPEAEVQSVLSRWLNREIAFSDLEQALQAIADLYQSRGWFARPQLPEQDLGDDGSVRINVLEGRLGAIRVDPAKRPPLVEERLIGMLSQGQKPDGPLHLDSLDRAVSLVNELSGVRITAALAPGDADAQSDVVVQGESKGWGGGSASFDNTGSRSTGYSRISSGVTVDNPRQIGDQVSLNAMGSEGVRYARLGYSFPVGYKGWRVGLNTSAMTYKLIGSFASTQAEGTSTTHGLTASYPVSRGSLPNTTFSFSYDRKALFNEAGGRPISDKRLDSLSLSLGGDRSDRLGQGGITLWNLAWSGGYLDLSRNADSEAADQRGPDAAGRFHKLGLTLSRLQRLNDQDAFWLSFQAQGAFKNLDSAEKLSLGGSQAVRAFPSGEASGDSGATLTLELRHSITPEWQFIPFYDLGWIRINHQSGFAGAPALNSYALRGMGFSLSYTKPGLASARLTLARRLDDNPAANPQTGADGDGTRHMTRAWLSTVVYF